MGTLISLLLLAGMIASGCGVAQRVQQAISGAPPAPAIEKPQEEEPKPPSQDAAVMPKPAVEQVELPRFEKAQPPKPLPPSVTLDAKRLVHTDEPVLINIDSMPLSELIVHALGGMLKVNLFIDEQVKNMKDPVTIRSGEPLPPDRALNVVLGVLESKNLYFEERAGTLFIYRTRPGVQRPADIGVGRDVPDSPASVLQVVVFKYARAAEIDPLLREFYKSGVATKVHPRENALILSGQAGAIKAMMDFIETFDVPYVVGKKAFIIKLIYWQPDDFVKQIAQILEGMGFNIARTSRDPGISFIPIKLLNSVLVLAPVDASAKLVLQWRERLDTVESAGTEEKAFTYVPEYAKAADIVESIKRVYGIAPSTQGQLGGQAVGYTDQAMPPSLQPPVQFTQPPGILSQPQQQQAARLAGAQAARALGAQAAGAASAAPGLKIAADERRNVLLLVTTPANYRSILVLLRELDTPAKQVLIDATVAELTLSDDLSLGFEFFIKTKIKGSRPGDLDITTIPSDLNLGGKALVVQFLAADERLRTLMNLLETENKVNVLSRPRLMVLDNQEATIQIGTDVPILTQQTQQVGTEQTILQNVQYRNTGVLLTIKPTINAKGLLTLDISQEVSEVGAAGVGGSPQILTRRIRTSVVAANEQTVVLGGLMSENTSINRNKVPWLGDLPVFGYLFKSESTTKRKTELIVFISPQILGSVDETTRVSEELKQEMKWLK